MANPYLAFALLIHACLYGMENDLPLPPATDLNTYTATAGQLSVYKKLPASLSEAYAAASGSAFIRRYIPFSLIEAYRG
jgi:glutamine synthetase